MPHVFWEQSIVRNVARANRPVQNERFYKCLCSHCGATYWLRKADITRAEKRNSGCSACAINSVAKYLRAHMNKPERLVYSWLTEMDCPFSPQAVLILHQRGYIVDFLLDGLVIEIDGEHWHSQPKRAEKDQSLDAAWHGKIIRLNAADIVNHPDSVRDQLEMTLLLSA